MSEESKFLQRENTAKYITIAIEGTIGAGKTSIITELAHELKLLTLYEPIRSWTTNGLLKNFYDNPKEYAFQFERICYDSFRKCNCCIRSNSCLQERSLYSAYYVFTASLFRQGYLTELEFKKLTKRFNKTLKETEALDAIIYIRTPTETALQRIKERGREEEEGIDKKYLEELENFYDNLFIHLKQEFANNGITIYMLDGMESKEQLQKSVSSIIEQEVRQKLIQFEQGVRDETLPRALDIFYCPWARWMKNRPVQNRNIEEESWDSTSS